MLALVGVLRLMKKVSSASFFLSPFVSPERR